MDYGNNMSEIVAENLDQAVEFLLRDLAKMLKEETNLIFIVDGDTVRPDKRFAERAKQMEYGSSLLKIKAQPYIQKTIKKWKEKHGLE